MGLLKSKKMFKLVKDELHRPPVVASRMSHTVRHEKWKILLPMLCLGNLKSDLHS